MPPPLQLAGMRFGRLTVIRRTDRNISGQWRWLCHCSCGGKAAVLGVALKNGTTKSCGCFHREAAAHRGRESTTHGHTVGRKPSAEYVIWRNMVQRCTDKNATYWKDYGGRGVRVCRRWRLSFAAFLSDMGKRPRGRTPTGKRPRYTLDRIKNHRGYFRKNCHWATWAQQARNRRSRYR